MKVSEIFYSIQGEGINIGKPSIFVRFSGCNLRCKWCDTKYTWVNGKEMNVEEIVKKIEKYPCKHIVWTGGEPTLQLKNMDKIYDSLDGLYTQEIETNGVKRFDIDSWLGFDTITISPKREKLNIRFLKDTHKFSNVYYKFVVTDKKDFDYWLSFITKLDLPNDRVIFMNEGTDNKKLKKNSKWLVKLCKKYNFRFSPRLQIWLWGNKRGV